MRYDDGTARNFSLKSNFSDLIPSIKARYRGELQLRGKRVAYKDVPKFVLRDSMYIPYMFADDIKSTDKVVNMLPALCIGAVELLIDAECDSYDVFGFLVNLVGKVDIGKVYEVIDKELTNEYDKGQFNAEFSALLSMRYCRNCFDRVPVKTLVNLLFLMYYIKPEAFCEAVITICTYVYSYLPMYCISVDEVANSIVNAVTSMVGDANSTVLETKPFGVITYTRPDKDRKYNISDDTGFGICMFSLLLLNIYKECSDDYGGRTKGYFASYDTYLEMFNKCACNCIGDDYTGSFYSGVKFKYKRSEDEPSFFGSYYENINMPNYTTDFKLGKSYCNRDAYEEALLFCMYSGLSKSKMSDITYNVDMHYSSYMYIRAVAMTLCCHADSVSCEQDIFDFSSLFESSGVKKVSQFKDLDDKIVSSCGSSSIERELKLLKGELTSLRSKYNSACETIDSMKKSHEDEVNSLLYRLSSKDDIITTLQEKYNSVSEEIKSYYCDEYTEDDKDDSSSVKADVSIEDMIKFLNTRTVLVLGGHDNFIGSVNAKGLTNIIRFDKATDMKSSVPTVDYISIHTRFVSHNLIETAKDRYRDSPAITFYYNGTSADGFIRAYYDFVCRSEKG